MLRSFNFRFFLFALAIGLMPYAGHAETAAQVAGAPAQKPAAKTTPKPVAPVTGIIDLQRISTESTALKSVRAQFEDRRGKLRDEFAKLENELRAAEQELERQRGVLSPDAFEEKQLAFERRKNDAQRKADSSRRQLDDAFQEALRKIQATMIEVAASVADQLKLDLVLQRAQVIFWSDELDITEPVLQGLNAKMPSVKLGTGHTPEGGGEKPAAAPPPQQ